MKIILLIAILYGCTSITESNPVAPTPITTDIDQCQPAEQHLQQLCDVDKVANAYCCAVVAPTKKGKTFTQFCQDKQNDGVFLNPKCVANVKSCENIDACTSSK